MPVERGVTQSRWDYVNVRGFGALTVALVRRSRAIILLPVGGREGINQHGELAVVEQAQRAEQPTADRDRFSFNCGEGVRESVADSLRHSLAAKGGNDGRWYGRLCRPDERVPF